jgi:cytochrome c oxidase cbb3-type subunit 2
MSRQHPSHQHAILTVMMLAGLSFGALAAQAGDATAGKLLYEKHCLSCHGASGDGKGPATQDMDRNPRSFIDDELKFDTDADWQRGTDKDIADVINLGAAAFGGSSLMPPWGALLSDDDTAGLVSYIQTLKSEFQ